MYKKRKTNPVMLSSLFQGALEGLGIDEKMKDMQMLSIWKEVAGDKLAAKTFAYMIDKDKNAVIGVKSAPLAQELQFLKKDLEKKFNAIAEKRFNRTIKGLYFKLMDQVKEV